MKRGLLLTTLLAAGLLLSLLTWWPFESRPDRDGRAHLDHLRSSGLLAGARAQTRLGEVRRIVPVATRWSAPGEPFWWAELNGPDGSAGYLAWRESGDRALLDFSLEGLVAIDLPQAQALGGVPAIQQFPLQGADGQAVASGCVPTAGASLIAYWSNRGTFDWQADDSHEGLVRRVRDRLPMSVIADVRVTVAPFRSETLAEELAAGRPALVSCVVLVPRKPELAWGHEVVAVGQAEIAGVRFVGVVDNYFAPRIPGTIRWIQAERCSSLVLVRPRR